ncbi:MAG: DoxX family protein [Gemmatimonadota bacterium]|nr:DoxX family protein [Gemmatimonadota bacterium]MDH3424311.1 DoxX family protein [Gemmatimonadota bacterium]
MSTLAIIAQVAIALGIFNVWIIRRDRPTPFRPDGASNMEEEFRRYGLPDWVRVAVGTAKVSLAVLLLVGVFFAPVAIGAAGAMALLMLSAVAAHFRVGDPIKKAMPAFLMLALSLLVVVGHTV